MPRGFLRVLFSLMLRVLLRYNVISPFLSLGRGDQTSPRRVYSLRFAVVVRISRCMPNIDRRY